MNQENCPAEQIRIDCEKLCFARQKLYEIYFKPVEIRTNCQVLKMVLNIINLIIV